jgi:hypothetical protein
VVVAGALSPGKRLAQQHSALGMVDKSKRYASAAISSLEYPTSEFTGKARPCWLSPGPRKLQRGLSAEEVAGFLRRTVDEVQAKARELEVRPVG